MTGFILDIEANGLKKPTQIWCIVCKDIATGSVSVFREPTTNAAEKERFLRLLASTTLVVGHNILEYDIPVLCSLLGCSYNKDVVDTLIISRLVNYSRTGGHSIEAYGEEFGYPKITFSDFSKYSKDLEDRCITDVEICNLVYRKYSGVLNDPAWQASILLETRFQRLVNDLHDNGFSFNIRKANTLRDEVSRQLEELDSQILEAFPPREVLIKEFTPRATKHGTISKQSVPKVLWNNIHEYEIGKTYRHTKLEPFNLSSPKQIVQVLNEAGWLPINKTKTHIDTERELNHLRYRNEGLSEVDLKEKVDILKGKLEVLKKTGWKVDETNLSTLPETAPNSTRLLAKRILLESRRRTLTEWIDLCDPDTGRIHGKFVGIGAWTHRMAHQNPNTANIPREFQEDGSVKLLGKEMRQLWQAPRNRLLVGVDAEGIQLRIFAHYINDPEFTDALVRGDKAKKTDPHSLNQRILGSVCKSRQAAKRFIYALLLGAGMDKLSQILQCSKGEAEEALDRLLQRYQGFAELKRTAIPRDARNGYFIGLDGRKVRIPGDTPGERRHLCMSGYLQNGEAVVMKKASLKWYDLLSVEDIGRWLFVNFVHDEWQTETKNDMDIAIKVAKIQADSLRIVGEELGLKCPLAGSYWNDDHNDYTIGVNWYQTH